ncbi:putative baseplate J/gp47 family protein [Vibrio phage 501E54-1]|nr:putative baseplate J/gp47 family protein [Vibrio phage 501E54-1]
MSYGVTPKGFIGKPFKTTLESMVERSKLEFGEKLPTAPETVAGQFLNIIAAEISDAWSLGEDVAAMQNREWAEGVYLDYLARIAGLTRLQESGSTGGLLFTGRQGTVIKQFTACKDSLNRNVLTDTETVINRSNCYSSSFKVSEVADNTEYTLIIEGTTFTINSGSAATGISILNALVTAIGTPTTFSITLDSDSEVLEVVYQNFNNNLSTTNSYNLELLEVGMIVLSTSALTGTSVNFPSNTLVTLVSSNLGINSVTNPESFQNGRDRETDAELRFRMDSKEESAGTATKPAIEAALSEVEGVVSALVVRNNTLSNDTTTGIPAKHFETYVRGGNDARIAEVLWKTAPLFGNFWGDVTQTITDENGVEQDIRFTRPSDKYAHMTVTYALDPEGEFPANGEDAMKDAVVAYGNARPSGTDFVPNKYYAPLYTIEGMIVSDIQIAVTDLPTDTPTFQGTSIPVGAIEFLEFSSDRITITT